MMQEHHSLDKFTSDQTPLYPEYNLPTDTRLKDLEDHVALPNGWTISYDEPSYLSDKDPTLTLSNRTAFDESKQSHNEIPATGVTITITESEVQRYGTDYDHTYETECTPVRHEFDITTTRLVHIASLSEAAEWAHRIVTLVERTPDDYVLMDTNSQQLLRFKTTCGSVEFQLIQVDRDFNEARSYNLYRVDTTTSNIRIFEEKGPHMKNLSTNELPKEVLNALHRDSMRRAQS